MTNLSQNGIPVRGGAIQYSRVEPGHQVATVYGVGPRPFRINVVRSMDDPTLWRLEPCYVYRGVEQEPLRAGVFLDGYAGSRDPVRGLHAAKRLLRDVWREWRDRG